MFARQWHETHDRPYRPMCGRNNQSTNEGGGDLQRRLTDECCQLDDVIVARNPSVTKRLERNCDQTVLDPLRYSNLCRSRCSVLAANDVYSASISVLADRRFHDFTQGIVLMRSVLCRIKCQSVGTLSVQGHHHLFFILTACTLPSRTLAQMIA